MQLQSINCFINDQLLIIRIKKKFGFQFEEKNYKKKETRTVAWADLPHKNVIQKQKSVT